jgi:hypothetical protein
MLSGGNYDSCTIYPGISSSGSQMLDILAILSPENPSYGKRKTNREM